MDRTRKQIRWNGWGWAAHHDDLAERDAFWRWLAGELGMPALLATPARALEDITLPPIQLTDEQIGAFTKLLGADRVRQDNYERALHARGRSCGDLLHLRAGDLSGAPDAVLYPRGEDEVLAILQLAAREKIGVVPFGGGTSTTGGVSAGPGRVSVDLSGMDKVLDIDTQNGTVMAEAGIAGAALEKTLVAKDLRLNPASEVCEFSTLGGWIAGSGRVADGILGARLATPQGFVDIRPGSNLKYLMQGSQGAFGIVTRATMPVCPAVMALARAFLFADFGGGIAALREAARAEFPCLTLRLSDPEETRFEQAFADLENPPGLIRRLQNAWRARHADAGAALAIATFADAAAASRFEALVKKHGATPLGEALAKRRLGERFLVPYRQNALLDRGIASTALEVAASWSLLPALHAAVRTALDRAIRDNAPRPGAKGLVQCHVGHAHAGGANLCFTALFPRQLENEIAQEQAIRRAGLEAATGHGGAENEINTNALDLAVLRGVKAALDPEGVMNPGKLI